MAVSPPHPRQRQHAPGSEVAVRAIPYSTLNLELRPPTTTSSKRKVLISGSPAILYATGDSSDGAKRRCCRHHGASTREVAVGDQRITRVLNPTLAKCHQCCFVCTSLNPLIFWNTFTLCYQLDLIMRLRCAPRCRQREAHLRCLSPVTGASKGCSGSSLASSSCRTQVGHLGLSITKIQHQRPAHQCSTS